MKRLVLLIRQLALTDARMGGYRDRFNEIRTAALQSGR
jgi:hypothetical protein